MTVTQRRILLAAAIFLLAMNLRGSFLAVTPLLEYLGATYSLDGSALGWLTSIPLIVFALLSPFVGVAGARCGVGRLLLCSVLIMIVGVLLRFSLGVAGLYIGTLVLAVGIVAGNVLLPAVVSAFFPGSVNLMMGTYTSLMQVTTGVALATIAPLAFDAGWGWRWALLFWSWPLLGALCLWFPLYKLDILQPEAYLGNGLGEKRFRPLPSPVRWVRPTVREVFRHALAWDVSLYMGLQSLVFFSVSTWLPSMLIARGIPFTAAGSYLACFQITSLLTTFCLPFVIRRYRSQSVMASGLCVGLGSGIVMAHYTTGPVMAWVTTGVLGVAAGGVFAMAMLFFVLRATTPEQSAVLSGVGQAWGYLLASTMPVFLGYLHDITGTWTYAQLVLIAWTIVFAILGLRAGRNCKIPQAQEVSGIRVRKVMMRPSDFTCLPKKDGV